MPHCGIMRVAWFADEPKMFAIGASRNGGGTQASLQMGGNNAKFVEWLSLGHCPVANLRGSRRETPGNHVNPYSLKQEHVDSSNVFFCKQ